VPVENVRRAADVIIVIMADNHVINLGDSQLLQIGNRQVAISTFAVIKKAPFPLMEG
jgi:hypothetical protein